MDAVLGVLSTIGQIFGKISGAISTVTGILREFGVVIFLAGFIGLLFAFLWFLFRYLDKKRLTGPVLFFVLFFVIFLGGNLLLLSGTAKTAVESPAQAISAETTPAEDVRI